MHSQEALQKNHVEFNISSKLIYLSEWDKTVLLLPKDLLARGRKIICLKTLNIQVCING
jgi:hypothetical protein